MIPSPYWRRWSTLLLLLSALGSQLSSLLAATVTGTLILPNGNLYSGRINFAPIHAPLVVSPGVIVTATAVSVTTTNGVFSAALEAGSYRLSATGIPEVRFTVPDTDLTYSLLSLVTAGLAQAPDFVPVGLSGDWIDTDNGTWTGTLTGDLLVGNRATFADFRRSVPFGQVMEDDDSLPTFGFLRDTVDAYGETIDDVLALPVPLLTRTAWVKTGAREGWWMFCPDSLTADNADDIRRPADILTDLDPGRWEFVMGPGGGGGGGSGTVTSVTLTQPAAGLTITSSGVAITTSGTRTFALANDLAALENLSGTGYPQRTGTDAWSISTTIPWSSIATTPTTLSGYGITDPVVLTSGTYSNPAWITGLAWSKISGTPTTLSGYGITDGITSAAVAAGYQPLDADLTSLAGLTTTAFGRGLLELANAAALRTAGGLVIGTDVQAYDADLADLADGSLSGSKVGSGIDAGNITAGTLPDGRFPATLPASSGANLTALNASNLGSGTIPGARLPHSGRRRVTYVVDGGGSPITSGASTIRYAQVPITGTITRAEIVADQTGSAVVDVWVDTYANYPPTVLDTITASAKPTLSSANKHTDSTLTGWDTAVAAGEYMAFRVDSASTVTVLTVTIEITPP